MFFYISGILYYVQVIIIYLSSLWGAPLSTRTAKTYALTGSTFGIFTRFISGMEIKQKPVDSLNFFNDTLLITVCVCFATKHDVLFIEAMRLHTGSAYI